VEKLANAKGQMNYTIKMAMKTLDKAILLIPDDKLDYKPTEETMTAADLAIHIYTVSLV
jgi:hypothetical protein